MSLDLTQPITLRPRRLKYAAFLVLSLVFVAGGILIIKSPGQSAATGWACVIFFGFFALVFAVILIPGTSYLRIERDGITICGLFGAKLIPWCTVNGFGVTRLRGRRVVGMNLIPGSPIAAGIGRINAGLLGYEGMLHDTYGMSAAELAALMNEALARAKLAGRKV